MEETLTQIIQGIENLSDSLRVNKEELTKKTLKEWEEKNKSVRERSEGKSFLEQYTEAYGKYDGFRTLAPYSLPKDFKENLVDLALCIGYKDYLLGEDKWGYLTNAAGLGGSLGIIFALSALGFKAVKKKLNRRNFLESATIPFIIGVIYGGGCGFICTLTTKGELNEIKQNAVYLDKIYNKYIH